MPPHSRLTAAAALLGRRLVAARRLAGGTKKGVHRLSLDDGGTVIAYLWHAEEGYWPEGDDGLLGAAGGLDLFTSAHAALTRLGVRVPAVLATDRGGAGAGDLAVVEDVRGGALEALWRSDPQRARRVLHRLAGSLRAMHGDVTDRYGRPSAPHGDGLFEDLVLERAVGHLATAAARVERIRAARHRLAAVLGERRAAVAPRARHGLVHGELGPDHVLVDDRDEPVLIDIESCMHVDVEWEHVFLELRFGEHYPVLATPGLDAPRLRLYRLATYLSLVAGPLTLLDRGFPDRAAMTRIVEHNVERTLDEPAAR